MSEGAAKEFGRQLKDLRSTTSKMPLKKGVTVEEPATGIEAVVPKDAVVKEATIDDAEPAEAMYV